MLSAILLSAGMSSRFGSPKALAQFNGKTVIEHLQCLLVDSKIDEVIIVLGAHSTNIKPYILKHKKVKVVYNKDYNLGQTSSFKIGLSSIEKVSRYVFLLPVDYPAIKKETIDYLCQEFEPTSPLILIPTYEGKKGHPPVFNMSLKEEFMELDNGKGLNRIARKHTEDTVYVPVNDSGVIATFNTPEELDELKQKFI